MEKHMTLWGSAAAPQSGWGGFWPGRCKRCTFSRWSHSLWFTSMLWVAVLLPHNSSVELQLADSRSYVSMQNVLINLGIIFPFIFSTRCVVAFLLATRFRCPGTSLSVAYVEHPGALVKTSNLQQCFFYFILFFWTASAPSMVSSHVLHLV